MGLFGFPAFFFTVAASAVSLGITIAFVAALLAALATLFGVARVLRMSAPDVGRD